MEKDSKNGKKCSMFYPKSFKFIVFDSEIKTEILYTYVHKINQ